MEHNLQLSEAQLSVISANLNGIKRVLGFAGVGKTTVAIERMMFLHHHHNIPFNDIYFIVRSEELARRMRAILNQRYDIPMTVLYGLVYLLDLLGYQWIPSLRDHYKKESKDFGNITQFDLDITPQNDFIKNHKNKNACVVSPMTRSFIIVDDASYFQSEEFELIQKMCLTSNIMFLGDPNVDRSEMVFYHNLLHIDDFYGQVETYTLREKFRSPCNILRL